MVWVTLLCISMLGFLLLPTIKGNSCGSPPILIHGRVRVKGDAAYYSCNKGFAISGPRKIRCQATGQWKKANIRCAPGCQAPSVPENARFSRSSEPKANYKKGEIVFFSCQPGYRMAGTFFQRCLGRKWSTRRFTCVVSRDCGSPDVPTNGEFHGSNYSVGSTVQYACDPGFALEGDDLSVCLRNKTWSGSVPICRAVDCGSLPDPKNGKKTVETRTTFGGRAEFRCEGRGFTLVGSKERFCQADGGWSGAPALCKASCKDPGIPKDGKRQGSRFNHGASVRFRCKTPLKMIGPRQIKCSDGIWSKSLPVCRHPTELKDYSECGIRKDTSRLRMVGGRVSSRGKWPWQVGIYRLERASGKEKFLCGGALINRQWILTGAHCFMYEYTTTNQRSALISPPSMYKIMVGDNHQDTKERSQRSFFATKIIMHSGYNDDFFDNDIALVKLSGRARLGVYVRTICLPTENDSLTLPGRRGFVAGWGATQVLNPGETPDPKNAVSPKLKHAKFKIQDAELCRNSTDYFFNESTKFCAGTDKPAVGVCQGDSGGPFVTQGSSQKWFAAGLVSWGEGCGIIGRYTYYTKITPYIGWIMKFVSGKK